jgi:hypothetical protein
MRAVDSPLSSALPRRLDAGLRGFEGSECGVNLRCECFVLDANVLDSVHVSVCADNQIFDDLA